MSSRGFTVLEMMVVLVIISLALSLGFQSLGQWQIAESTLNHVSTTTRARALTSQWWVSSIRGLTPLTQHPFQGDRQRLSGYTLTPIFATQGALTKVQWEIAEAPELGLSLQLSENEKTHVFPLPDAKEAQFIYRNEDGELSKDWPSSGLGLESKNLPAYVELQIRGQSDETYTWVAYVIGPLEPWYRPLKWEDD